MNEEVDIWTPDNPITDILLGDETPPDWLIPDFLLQGAMVLMAGAPGAGKSYISYTIGLAVASGIEALSGIIPAAPPRKVVYFDQENSEQDRNKYLRRSYFGLERHGVKPDPFILEETFWPVHYELGDDDWPEKASRWIEHVKPHLIVFDTATPCFNIEDENNNAEATRTIKLVRDLMDLTDPVATSIILKHERTRVDKGKRTIRGAKAWQGAADGVMFQCKLPGRPTSGLTRTRLEPDKTRAYGLTQTIYITPSWTDDAKSGLVLAASHIPDAIHRKGEEQDEGDDDKD